jgi:hypothetical protein
MSATNEDPRRPPAGAHASCALCGHNNGDVKVYRDPFGTAIAPGRWPNLTMHSDCFLAYIRAAKAAVRELSF